MGLRLRETKPEDTVTFRAGLIETEYLAFSAYADLEFFRDSTGNATSTNATATDINNNFRPDLPLRRLILSI